MNRVSTIILALFVFLGGVTDKAAAFSSLNAPLQDEDSVIWRLAVQFTTLYNNGDTAGMNKLLPEDFMLQLLHDNFLGKKSLLNSMTDSAVHNTFKHQLKLDGQTLIRYADDNSAASLNASLNFLDPSMAESVKKERGYGLCIMYFQKRNGKWMLRTVHLDLHCSLCNE